MFYILAILRFGHGIYGQQVYAIVNNYLTAPNQAQQKSTSLLPISIKSMLPARFSYCFYLSDEAGVQSWSLLIPVSEYKFEYEYSDEKSGNVKSTEAILTPFNMTTNKLAFQKNSKNF